MFKELQKRQYTFLAPSAFFQKKKIAALPPARGIIKNPFFGYSEHFLLHFPPSLKYLRRVTVSNLKLAKNYDDMSFLVTKEMECKVLRSSTATSEDMDRHFPGLRLSSYCHSYSLSDQYLRALHW